MSFALIMYHYSRWLPQPVKKSMRRWFVKYKAWQRKSAMGKAITKYGTFDAKELIAEFRNAGIKEGSVLFVHCSFNDLFTFTGSPMDILNALRTLAGPLGTLLMPAYTFKSASNPTHLFDVTREPTYTGLVNELFRRSPGVMRSLHPRHSICGEGPLVNELLSGHNMCVMADGPDSPFDRLRRRDDSYILTIGLPPGYISILHWLEDIDPAKMPIPVHENKPMECQVRDINGKIKVVQDWQIMKNVAARLDYYKFSRYLSPSAMLHWKYKGVEFGVYPVKVLSEELLALRDRGIVHYI